MRHLLRSGIVATALLVLGGIAGSPASATVLCKAVPNAKGECSTASGNYVKGQIFKASSKTTVLTLHEGAAEKITCGSEIEIEQTSTAGTEVTAQLKKLEFTGCVYPTQPLPILCIGGVGTEKLPAKASFVATDDKGNGTFTVSGELLFVIDCPGVKCVVNAAGATLSVTGASTGVLTALEVTTSVVARMGYTECPKATLWDDTYTLFSPKALWVGTTME
jgi:hypothetical protein